MMDGLAIIDPWTAVAETDGSYSAGPAVFPGALVDDADAIQIILDGWCWSFHSGWLWFIALKISGNQSNTTSGKVAMSFHVQNFSTGFTISNNMAESTYTPITPSISFKTEDYDKETT